MKNKKSQMKMTNFVALEIEFVQDEPLKDINFGKVCEFYNNNKDK